eukprot:gene27130-biopygen17681
MSSCPDSLFHNLIVLSRDAERTLVSSFEKIAE